MNIDDLDFIVDSDDGLFGKSSPPSIADLEGPLRAPRSVIPPHVVQATVATVVSEPKSPEGGQKSSSQRKRTLSKSTDAKSTPAKKLRAHNTPCKPASSSSKPERATWTTSALEILIETRWSETAKTKFHSCKTNNEKSEFWSWLAIRFNLRANTCFEVRQIKNRVDALKTEFKQIVGASKATGNSIPVNYPAHWDCLHSHLKVGVILYYFVKDSYWVQVISGMQPLPIAESLLSSTSLIQKSSLEESAPQGLQSGLNSINPKKQEKEKRAGPAKNLGENIECGFATIAASISELAASRLSKPSGVSSENTILSKLEAMQTKQNETASEQSTLLHAMLAALNRIGDTLSK